MDRRPVGLHICLMLTVAMAAASRRQQLESGRACTSGRPQGWLLDTITGEMDRRHGHAVTPPPAFVSALSSPFFRKEGRTEDGWQDQLCSSAAPGRKKVSLG